MSNKVCPAKVADEVIELYRQFAMADYIGEHITQAEHMTQAAVLAKQQGYNAQIELAAFLHDIGHLLSQSPQQSMGGYGAKEHEQIGATFLQDRGFPEIIVKLVQSHVDAKRYLTYTKPQYYNTLSDASKKTLQHQGGPMSAEEAFAFEQAPYFEEILQMRMWDEAAKETGLPLPDYDYYRQLIIDVLETNAI